MQIKTPVGSQGEAPHARAKIPEMSVRQELGCELASGTILSSARSFVSTERDKSHAKANSIRMQVSKFDCSKFRINKRRHIHARTMRNEMHPQSSSLDLTASCLF